jgi:hypothetical protein
MTWAKRRMHSDVFICTFGAYARAPEGSIWRLSSEKVGGVLVLSAHRSNTWMAIEVMLDVSVPRWLLRNRIGGGVMRISNCVLDVT